MTNRKSESMRVLRDVGYQARLEERRFRNAKTEFVFLSCLVALLLGVDYTMARIMFDYLDPTLGGVSLGPEFLALSVPTAVVAVHLLISDDDGQTIEYRLRRLASVGVFIFLFGMAAMVALVYFDAADGLGVSGQNAPIDGTIGQEDIGGDQSQKSWLLSLFGKLFSSIPPIIFFLGMTVILFVTVYACHRLMTKIEERYEFFMRDRGRARDIKALIPQIEAMRAEIEAREAARKSLIKKLPRDAEKRFSQIASAEIHAALHRMKKSVNGLSESDELMDGIFQRKAALPPHIKTREQGLEIIADIRHRTSPYAILIDLSYMPPEDEED